MPASSACAINRSRSSYCCVRSGRGAARDDRRSRISWTHSPPRKILAEAPQRVRPSVLDPLLGAHPPVGDGVGELVEDQEVVVARRELLPSDSPGVAALGGGLVQTGKGEASGPQTT